MAKSTSASPLTTAAAAFDDALATYARLAELFVKTPLASIKQLERANATLDELAACEGTLQAAAQVLLAALGEARGRQERLAGEVVARAPELERRNRELRAVMDDMAALAADVGALNAVIAEPNAEATADVAGMSTRLLELSARAEQLGAAARSAGFDEVASQGHALHKRLLAISHKLARAAPN
jgi:septal ring factor EnvC (AmiA/AmiB activator)